MASESPKPRGGYIGFSPDMPWSAAIEAYYEDNMATALRIADEHGLGARASYLGLYRTIEAEAMTRESASIYDSQGWLLLESHPDLISDLERSVVAACDQVVRMFHWQHGPRVLFTILHPDSDAPFVPGRDGYFADKYPYDKVCLPSALLRRPQEFAEAVRHEYAHAMVLDRAQGRCPLWLNEAVAMVAQTEGQSRVRQVWQWLSPDELDLAYREDRESYEGSPVVASAYRQSHVIGEFLNAQKGSKGIGQLLDAFDDNSFVQELMMRVKNQRPEDEALRQVYGFGVDELFREAQGWSG